MTEPGKDREPPATERVGNTLGLAYITAPHPDSTLCTLHPTIDMDRRFINQMTAIANDLINYIANMPRQSRFARFITGNVSRDEYALWLGNTLRYVPQTVQVHTLAAKALSADPAKQHLAPRHEEGAAEEHGHEVLLINDLNALGYDVTLLSVDTIFDTSSYIRAFAEIELPMIGSRNGIGAFGIATIMERLSATTLLEHLKTYKAPTYQT